MKDWVTCEKTLIKYLLKIKTLNINSSADEY